MGVHGFGSATRRTSAPVRSLLRGRGRHLVDEVSHVAGLASRETTWRRAATGYLAFIAAADFVIALLVATAMASRQYPAVEALAAGLLAAAGFVLATALCRGYRRANADHAGLRSLLQVAGLLGVTSLPLQGLGVVDLPHALVFQALMLTIALATVSRLIQRTVIRNRRAAGRLARRTLLVGTVSGLRPVSESLEDARLHGLTVVGICTPRHDGVDSPVTDTYSAVPQLVTDLAVETVVISADAMDSADLRRLGWRLRHLPVELLVLPPLADVAPHRLHLEPMGGTPLLAVSFIESRIQRLAKALVDRVVGSLILLGVLPVIAVAGMAVRLDSRGPAFFAQTRVGLDGRHFTMYKLRSMDTDSEARLAALQAQNDGNGMLFKMHDDPRVTRVGRTLRRLSIDELPQLWNVVKGDMSLVGPRPALPREVATYTGDVAHRLTVKPGLTGLWQVSGRSNLSAERSIRLDLRYADNWTVSMDANILLRTARAVLRGDGAY